MASPGVMEKFVPVPFYIFIKDLLAKDVSLPKDVIVALATNAPTKVIHAWSDERDTLNGPKLDSTTHAKGEWVETNNMSLPTQREILTSPQN